MTDRWVLLIHRRARKELDALGRSMKARVVAAIDCLTDEPRPFGCAKLRPQVETYRLRVGDYRIIYIVSDRDKTVTIVRVKHRQGAHKD